MAGNSAQQKRQMILLGVLIASVVIIVFIWYRFLRTDASEEAIIEQVPAEGVVVTPTQSKEAGEILGAIQVLKTVTLDTRFLSDERFTSLEITPVVIPRGQPSGTRTLGQMFNLGGRE